MKILFITVAVLCFGLEKFKAADFYETRSNLTHTCHIFPDIVCVDITVENLTCIDPGCYFNTLEANNTDCSLNITLNYATNGTTNHTNGTQCDGELIHPNDTSFCVNATLWNGTSCNANNITCKMNATRCSINPVFYIGGFFNLGDKDGWGNFPAAQMAINEVNNAGENLTNITLSLTAHTSTKGLLSYGTDLLYRYLNDGPPKLMLLLPQNNDLARTISAYSSLKQWGSLQFSYGTTDNSLAKKNNLFRRFYRLNPLEISLNRLRVAFVHAFRDWRDDIGLLYFADRYYEEVNSDLKERLKLKIVANVGFRTTPKEALIKLKKQKAHIILASFPSSYGKEVFCGAYKLGMYGPHYVWITYTLMPWKFWVPSPNEDLGCSEFEATCAAENHFSFSGASLSPKRLIIENNTFAETYHPLVDVGNASNRSSLAGYAYDSIWTMANILERARSTVEGRGKRLSKLSYNDTKEMELFEQLAQSTDFEGTTGRIRFFENGNRKFAMEAMQVRRDGLGWTVGSYDEDNEKYTPGSNILWQGGLPYKRTRDTSEWRNINKVLFIFWCLFAAVGILYALFCFGFVIIYRRKRCIKYSSPLINLCIIFGCLLNFITVILYGIDYQRASEAKITVICRVRLWMFSLGYTFCVGGLLAKVWSLYQILIERRVHRKRKMLLWMCVIVGVLFLIDIVYLAIWTAKDGLYRTFEVIHEQAKYQCFQKITGDPFLLNTIFIEICDCDNIGVWLGIFVGYKAIVFIIGLYMSWKVKKVYTRKLIDAQYCAVLFFVAVPFFILGIIFAFSLRLHPSPHFALLGLIIMIYSFIVLVTLFAHKIIAILSDPSNVVCCKTMCGGLKKRCRCCPPGFCKCLAGLGSCCAVVATLFCSLCCCCKSLREALLCGPKKNRDTVNKDDQMDYQIGNMPGDREKQIIILQKELEKKEKRLNQLKKFTHSTQAVKQTQTPSRFYSYGDEDSGNGSSQNGLGCSNESFEDDNNNNRNRHAKGRNTRFKVYHRKLDFSHVSSKVDSGLESKPVNTEHRPAETPENRSFRSSPSSQDAKVELLQKRLFEREKELCELREYLGIVPASSIEPSCKGESLPSINEEPDAQGKTQSPNVIQVIKKNQEKGIPGKTIVEEEKNKNGTGIEGNNSINGSFLNYLSESSSDESHYGKITDGKVSGVDANLQKSEENSSPSKCEQNSKIRINIIGETPNSELYSQDDLRATPKIAMAEKKVEENVLVVQEKRKTKDKRAAGDYLFGKDGNSVKEARTKSVKVSNSTIGQPYRMKPGEFKRKVRQLSAFGIFKPRNTNAIRPEIKVTSSNAENTRNRLPDQEGLPQMSKSSQYLGVKNNNDDNPEYLRSGEERLSHSPYKSETSLNLTVSVSNANVGESNLTGTKRDGVKIFNSSSDYSHVKSRLYTENNATGSKSSPNLQRKDLINDGDTSQVARSASNNTNTKSNVKIFNSPTDYSHVESRLHTENNTIGSKSSPNLQRKDITNDSDASQVDRLTTGNNKSNVKIFNSPTDYSHVESRLHTENNTIGPKSSPNLQRKDITNDSDASQVDRLTTGNNKSDVKIFNSPTDYTHVKSRLYSTAENKTPATSSKLSPSLQRKDVEYTNYDNSGENTTTNNGQTKNNVKIFNAPSDYTHVKARLFDSGNNNAKKSPKLKNKVNQLRSLGVLSDSQDNPRKSVNDQKTNINV